MGVAMLRFRCDFTQPVELTFRTLNRSAASFLLLRLNEANGHDKLDFDPADDEFGVFQIDLTPSPRFQHLIAVVTPFDIAGAGVQVDVELQVEQATGALTPTKPPIGHAGPYFPLGSAPTGNRTEFHLKLLSKL